jgi:hypothetical protein
VSDKNCADKTVATQELLVVACSQSGYLEVLLLPNFTLIYTNSSLQKLTSDIGIIDQSNQNLS